MTTALLPHHLADLRRSGLSDETIRAAGIRSEVDHHRLAATLNRKTWPRTCGPAMVFPFHDDTGAVVLTRVKPDHPQTRNGKPAKYLQPTGAVPRVYFPPGLNGDLSEPDRSLIVTEGEKKALAGTQHGFAAVGLIGVDCWHTKKSSTLLPDLERVEWKNRRVFIAFDSDANENENVKTNERLLGAMLKARGAVVKVVRFPSGPNGEKVGLDDFLVAHGPDELDKLINAAEEPEPVQSGEIKSPASELDPANEAATFITKLTADELPRLRRWQGMFLAWKSGAYREKTDEEVRSMVYRFLNARYFKVASGHVSNIIDQLKAQTELPWTIEPPAWLGKSPVEWKPSDCLTARNGVFHLPNIIEGRSPYQIPATPKLFVTSAVDYDATLDAPKPERWLQFLTDLWPDDPESIATLQEWFGYFLTADTSQQKILCLIGPKRSGKGTVARILRSLIGAENVAGPTLAGLAGPFGLWPLVGRSVAIIPDARLSGRSDKATVTERLLAISGEDCLTIDRKCLSSLHMKLGARLVILSNEVPRLADASGTVASRMICLRMTKSWFGREDHGLTPALLAELPGILLWAIGGWARLRQRGHFVQPASGADIASDMEDMASPVGAFVRERCIVGPEHEVSRADVFHAYTEWAKEQGKIIVPDVAGFGRDLRSVLPDVKSRQHRADGRVAWWYAGVGLRTGF